MIQTMREQEFDTIFRIMEESFPRDEYRPYEEQKALLADPRYRIFVAKDGESGCVRAFLAVWVFPTFVFVEHFAVDAAYRGQGLGASMLCELERLMQCPLCLEVELPDTEIARRRIAFYQRAGFFWNEYSYMQPSISAGRRPVPLRLMTTPHAVCAEEFVKIKEVLYREVYKVQG